MPSTRHKRARSRQALKPWEYAYLTGDMSGIEPGSRAEARVRVMQRDPDGYLLFGDKTANQLLQENPEYA